MSTIPEVSMLDDKQNMRRYYLDKFRFDRTSAKNRKYVSKNKAYSACNTQRKHSTPLIAQKYFIG